MDTRAIYDIVEKAKKYDELIFINRNKELSCSFCGKSQSAIEKLIAGHDVFICDECVKLCNEILNETNEEKPLT